MYYIGVDSMPRKPLKKTTVALLNPEIEKYISLFFLSLITLFNAVYIFPEIKISTYSLNDEVLHMSVVQAATDVLKNGGDPTDFWFWQIGLGFPISHYYQHLPHLVLTIANYFTSNYFSLIHLFDIFRYLLLVFFPLSIYISMRKFGFNYLSAGFSSLVSPLITTNGLYGFDYNSYLWRGPGLFTQLWAMFFLPLAISEIYCLLKYKGSWVSSLLLSSIVILSNVFYAYILCLTTLIIVFINFKRNELLIRIKKLLILFGLIFLVTSYFFIPLVLENKYLNKSIWEAQFKYDSYGMQYVLKNLFQGNLLDYGRIPVLTILLFISLVSILWKIKDEKYRFIFLLTIFWLVVYFGRTTWGDFFNLLPFSSSLHIHRFIGGFHLGSILVIGAGVSLFLEKIKIIFHTNRKYTELLLTGIFLLCLFPVLKERINYYSQNSIWKQETRYVVDEKKDEIDSIQTFLKNLPPGRIYSGLIPDFGSVPYYKFGSVPLFSLFPQLGLDSFGHAFYALPLTNDVRIRFDNTKTEQYNLFNIRYVLLHKSWTAPNYYTKINEFNDYFLYEISSTGYSDLVDVPLIVYGKKNDFYQTNYSWLLSDLPKHKEYLLIELENITNRTNGLPIIPFSSVNKDILNNYYSQKPSCGEIIKEKVDTNKYWVQFKANRDCYLVFKTNYHPGMVAYLDYLKVDTVMLSPGYIGVKIPAGIHQILFVYKQPFYRYLLIIVGLITVTFLTLRIPKKVNIKFLQIKNKISNLYPKFQKRFNLLDKNLVTQIIASLILTLMSIICVYSIKNETITVDELSHIAAGYSYLDTHDYRMNPEHPPLIKDIAAIPLLFTKINIEKNSLAWITSNQWLWGYNIFYQFGNNPDFILFWARIPMIILLIVFGWFVFYWVKILGDNKSALLALFLFAFCPNLIAHGRLVNTDVGASIGLALSLFFWLRFLKNQTYSNAAFAGLFIGLSMMLKLSLVIVLPILFLITLFYFVLNRTIAGMKYKFLFKLVVSILVGVSVISSVYYLHLLNYPIQKQLEDEKYFLSLDGFDKFEKSCLWMVDKSIFRPLSYYCYGISVVLEKTEGRFLWGTFLNGQISQKGYWYYFPLLYLVKIPLAFQLLTFFVVIYFISKFLENRFTKNDLSIKLLVTKYFDLFSIFIAILVYWIFAIKGNLNIGLRHLLPIIPLNIILVSLGIIEMIKSFQKKYIKYGLYFLLIWYFASSILVFPYYISYYNEIAGGVKNGYKIAVDSNYDWGQDLKRLAFWIEKNGISKIYIDYFGSADVNTYLKGKYIPWYGSVWWKKYRYSGSNFPKGNYLAVSANFLQTGIGIPTEDYVGDFGEYNWLKKYKPIARAGTSIFIYYIY